MGFRGNDLSSLRPNTNNFYYVPEFLVEYDRRSSIERYGEKVDLPKNSGFFIHFQEYDLPTLIDIPSPLIEGDNPSPLTMTKREVTGQIVQFGNYLTETDVLLDINEDGTANLKKGQAEFLNRYRVMEKSRHCHISLEGGTHKFYANGSAITDVNTVLDESDLEAILASFDWTSAALHAEEFTEIVRTDDAFGSVSIMPCFVLLVHPELRWDYEQLNGFSYPSDYPGGTELLPHEIGKWKRFRICLDDYCSQRLDGGAAIGSNNVKSLTGSVANVYNSVALSKNAFKTVMLQGEDAMAMIIHPTGSAGAADALNRFGTIGYKCYHACVPTHNHRYAILYSGATNTRS